jgi:hypothetical protein
LQACLLRPKKEELPPEALGLLMIKVVFLDLTIYLSTAIGDHSRFLGSYLEQNIIELNDLWLENLRSGLLSEGRWLHASWQRALNEARERDENCVREILLSFCLL